MIEETYVVCAALRKDLKIVCGPRHFDPIMRSQISRSEGPAFWKAAEQGFVDNNGKFLTRVEAKAIAVKQNQIRDKSREGYENLFSEDLY